MHLPTTLQKHFLVLMTTTEKLVQLYIYIYHYQMERMILCDTLQTLIVLTNGRSHPDVTLNSVERSVNFLHENNVTILPVSVTRPC